MCKTKIVIVPDSGHLWLDFLIARMVFRAVKAPRKAPLRPRPARNAGDIR